MSVGSPITLKYKAGRAGEARVNKIWWASVVLPAPRAPAITVKEYSGSPPPSTSSRPGTPVGSRVMATRDVALMLSLSFMLAPHPDVVAGDLRPGLADQAERQILADERDQQPNDVGEDGGEASLGVSARRKVTPLIVVTLCHAKTRASGIQNQRSRSRLALRATSLRTRSASRSISTYRVVRSA